MITVYTELIEHWAKQRGLHTADTAKQMLKAMEELGELAGIAIIAAAGLLHGEFKQYKENKRRYRK